MTLTSPAAPWRLSRWPLVQAPMAGSQDETLAVAVCQAGGLGSVPAAMLSPAALAQQLRALVAQTPAPYNVNFFCHRPPTVSDEALERWRQALQPLAQRWGVAPGPGRGAGRQPFDAAMAEVLEAFRPAVVSFHFGLPEPALLERVRAWGAQVWSSATTVDEARWLERQGVQAVVAQALEAGGHRGHFLSDDVGLQPPAEQLWPAVVKALKVPVVAAGGLASAAQVAQALAWGAQAVQVGTAFLLCPEARPSAVHRAALLAAQRHSPPDAEAGLVRPPTQLTRVFSGRPARGLENEAMRRLGPMCEWAPAFPEASAALQPIRQAAEAAGAGDASPLWCGARLSTAAPAPAAQVLQRLVHGLTPTSPA